MKVDNTKDLGYLYRLILIQKETSMKMIGRDIKVAKSTESLHSWKTSNWGGADSATQKKTTSNLLRPTTCAHVFVSACILDSSWLLPKYLESPFASFNPTPTYYFIHLKEVLPSFQHSFIFIQIQFWIIQLYGSNHIRLLTLNLSSVLLLLSWLP